MQIPQISKKLEMFIKGDMGELFHKMIYGEHVEERRKCAIKFMVAFEKAILEEDKSDK